MLETIVSSLIVALILLPAFIAYRHYSVYANISSQLNTYVFALVLAVIAFNFGKLHALTETAGMMETNVLIEQQDALIRNIKVSALIYFAFLIYFTVLDYLPKLLSNGRDNE